MVDKEMLSSVERASMTVGRSAIIRIEPLNDAKSYAKQLERLDQTWEKLYSIISDNGSLWVIASNAYIAGELYPIPLDLAYRIKTRTGFKLKNILVVYREAPVQGKPLGSGYFNILFFVKSLTDYYFNKDAVREPHIFKNIEWGKRTVGSSGYSDRISVRYSDKGRDPGNVWYKTDRTADGSIIRVYGHDDHELYSKIIELSTAKDWTVISNIDDNSLMDTAVKLGRKVKTEST